VVDVDLVARWARLDHDLAAHGLDPAPAHRDELLARWDEPARRYHGTAHLRAVLGHLDRWSGPAGPGPVARLAAWYHDAVHEPAGPGDDEARSAALARDHLVRRGAPAPLVDAVADAVVATAGHLRDPDGPVPAERALLLDADLAVLGTDPASYARYVEGVRAEWGHLDDEAWARGRAAVVAALSARRRLYLTPRASTERTATARRNLAAEAAARERRPGRSPVAGI
jgi:predicted metal-dependent HD superfamily phosphohydrolase